MKSKKVKSIIIIVTTILSLIFGVNRFFKAKKELGIPLMTMNFAFNIIAVYFSIIEFIKSLIVNFMRGIHVMNKVTVNKSC